MISKLYYEAHITIEPVFDEDLARAKPFAELYGFRVAELLMKKREEGTETRSKYDTFMTGHGKEYYDIQNRTACLVKVLQDAGFKVWRYKIEDTILDSRSNDELNLLEKI